MSIEASASAPWTIFERASAPRATHAVLVLNTPINFDGSLAQCIVDIWNAALLRITVDGGTDRWLGWINTMKSTCSSPVGAVGVAKPPDMITGDLDSIQPDTLQHFRESDACQVILTMDQCQTDFTKALLELKSYKAQHSMDIPHVLVLCDMSGRFDQTIGSISTLYKACEFLPECNVYLLSSTSLTWLLSPGVEHRIAIPRLLREEQKCCGLLPIGGRCRVTTSGLRWNLNNDVLEFGKLVSSSNTYDANKDTVIIQTDNFLTWTMEIDSYLSHVAASNININSNSNINSNNAHCANKL